jgi:ribosomal protein L16 Arg81 hydroxylase
MHYDASYNVFVQLHGSKRFTLLPPSAQVCSYPCLHPSIAHTQADPEALSAADFWLQCPPFPRLAVDCTADNLQQSQLLRCRDDGHQELEESNLEGYQVELTEGQALLLPPHWWHQVTTLSDSISFNVWSDAEEYGWVHEVSCIGPKLTMMVVASPLWFAHDR